MSAPFYSFMFIHQMLLLACSQHYLVGACAVAIFMSAACCAACRHTA